MISNFNSKIKEIVNLAKDKSTITEKVTVVHDYLKTHVKYTRPYEDETEDGSNWVYLPYGPIINGKSVCDGNTNKWLLTSQENTAYTHFPNGQLDSCGVTFTFPPAPYPGKEKWSFKLDKNKNGKTDYILVSYDGMNSTGLLEKNLSLCYKYVYFDSKGVVTESN